MALHHAQPGEVVALDRPLDPVAEDRNAALFKARDLEVLRLVMRRGESMPPHRVAGDVTVQCLGGEFEIGLPDRRVRLPAGSLVYLPGGMAHEVVATRDATALVTIALRSDGDVDEGPAALTSAA